MADFLLELRSEEIPARMQRQAARDLERLFLAELKTAGLAPGATETFVTPRRLALIVRDLPTATAATSEELKGPRTSAPQQALEGFLRKTGLTREQLSDRDGVWFAVFEKPGMQTADVLAAAIETVIRNFPWLKAMRWGVNSVHMEALRWVRPLQGIVALFDGAVVPVEIAGVKSGNVTRGHRFMSRGDIQISGPDAYVDALRKAHVFARSEDRAAIIGEAARKVAKAAGYTLIEDAQLLEENAGLTEWPVPLLGNFDPAFLDVPAEVVQLAMKSHQKYFAVANTDGSLAPAFICTANIEAEDGGKAIVAGNQKVLAARLSDARFFWDQDKKTPLEQHVEKLKDIVFHEKLGTVADKVDRVAKLARWLAEQGIVPNADPDLTEQAARLCKADLVTGMVYEFPELQGVMGGHYARAQGLPDEVANAIRDHYKPVGQGDDVPTDPVTVAVSLADKLDTLLSFFDIGELPTGSKDPFALRRAALSSIRLVLENQLKAHTDAPIEFWLGQGDPTSPLSESDIERRSLLTVVLDFLLERLAVQQRESGIRHDFVQASRRWDTRDDGRLDRVVARASSLSTFLATDDGANLLAGYKRAANILKAEAKKGALPTADGDQPSYDPDPAEAVLIAALDDAAPKAAVAVAAEDFEGAMSALAELRAPIDAFFDSVTVNDDDPIKRAFRLGLLARVRSAVHSVADFSRIEG